jgi:phosphatidylglycerophosphate synthase
MKTKQPRLDTRGDYESPLKQMDAPAEVVLVDPITLPIAKLLAKLQVSPLLITALAFVCRVGGACLFAINQLELGAASSIVGFYLDGIDGKVARIRHYRENLHGAIDFLLDQTAFAAMGIGALVWATRHGSVLSAVLVGVWLALYMVLMAFTSTWFRLLSQSGIAFTPGTHKAVFDDAMSSRQDSAVKRILAFLARLFAAARSWSERFRMMPYFGAIESEILIFMVAPFLRFNPVVLVFAALFLLPDIMVTFGLCILDLTKSP